MIISSIKLNLFGRENLGESHSTEVPVGPGCIEFWKVGNYCYLFYQSVLKEWVRSFKGLTLDAGCGTGTLGIKNTVGIDIDKSRLRKFADSGGMAVLGSVVEMPFKSDAFKNGIFMDVIEHIASKKSKAIAEVGRVVKGTLIGSTTNLLNPYMMLDVALPKAVLLKLSSIIGQSLDRHSRITSSQMSKALTKAGFSVELWCLSTPPFQPYLYQFHRRRVPWYGHIWIVTNKLVSIIKIAKDTMVFKAVR